MDGIWTNEGLALLQAAFSGAYTIPLTHFALSGAVLVGGLSNFILDPAMTEATFPAEMWRDNVHNSYIDIVDDHLVIECWVTADETDAFFTNGIGVIHDEGGTKTLMCIAPVPVHERFEGVFQKFLVKLPLTGDQAAAIDVSFRSEDAITPAELLNHKNDADAHHEKYTDAEAIAAIEAESGITLLSPTIASFNNAGHTHQGVGGGGVLDHNAATDNPTIAHGATGAVVGRTNTQTLTNKTLTTPTIASFVNSVHSHRDNAGGGFLIDSDYDVIIAASDGDYTSLSAYLADSPQANDRILVKVGETLTSTLLIATNQLEITIMPGVVFYPSSVSVTPLVKFTGSQVRVNGRFWLRNDTGGTLPNLLEIDNDYNHIPDLLIDEINSGSVVTDGVKINSSLRRNFITGRVAGDITNPLVQSSPTGDNYVALLNSSVIHYSQGAKTFDQPWIDDLTNMTHNHDDADINGGFLNRSTFKVRKVSSEQTITTGVETKVTFDTEDLDTNQDFDLTNDKYEPSYSGKFLLHASVEFKDPADGTSLSVRIEKNGSTKAHTSIQAAGTGKQILNVTAIVDANGTSHYFEVFVSHDKGSDLNIDNNSHTTMFSGFKIN
jgi:hypothetical protein